MKMFCAGSDVKTKFFNFLILGKSRFPPKKIITWTTEGKKNWNRGIKLHHLLINQLRREDSVQNRKFISI